MVSDMFCIAFHVSRIMSYRVVSCRMLSCLVKSPWIMLGCVEWCRVALRFVTLCCIVLHCIVSYRVVSCCVVLFQPRTLAFKENHGYALKVMLGEDSKKSIRT